MYELAVGSDGVVLNKNVPDFLDVTFGKMLYSHKIFVLH